MFLPKKIIIYQNQIKFKGTYLKTNIYSFLNNENTQQKIFSKFKKNTPCNISIQTSLSNQKITKKELEQLVEKCITICNKFNSKCIKISYLKKKIYTDLSSSLSLQTFIALLITTFIYSFLINQAKTTYTQYLKKLNKNKIITKKILNKLAAPTKPNTAIQDQINSLENILKAPLMLQNISITPQKSIIHAQTNQLEDLKTHYTLLAKKEKKYITIKTLNSTDITVILTDYEQ